MKKLLSAPTYRYIQAAVLVVLVIAFVTSFESGSKGAKTLGFPAGFEASLPIVCDVVAGVATFIHGRVRGDKPMRRLATQFVLGPMLLSWGANAINHASASPIGPGWSQWQATGWLAAVILAAGICPVAVAALLHLSTKYVEFEHRQAERAEKATAQKQPLRSDVQPARSAAAPKPAPKAAKKSAPKPEPVDLAKPERPALRAVPAADDRAAELIAAGIGRKRLAKELGISEHQARMLKEAKQG